jgi:fimbrial chaperone protein
VRALALAFLFSTAAAAAGLDVSPVQIELTRETSKALLSLRNGGEDTVRYQVSVFAWDEDPVAGMKLTKTDDIVFFPQAFSLKPGESRNVRVGAAGGFGAVEKTYRVFVEELPPAEKSAQPLSTVRVLTRIGVPVFLEPARALNDAKLGAVQIGQGKISAELRNDGNVRERVLSVEAQGLDASGKPLFEKQVQGWYVLAGGRKPYQIELPKDSCARVRKVLLTVRTQREQVLTTSADMPPGACG